MVSWFKLYKMSPITEDFTRNAILISDPQRLMAAICKSSGGHAHNRARAGCQVFAADNVKDAIKKNDLLVSLCWGLKLLA